MKTLDLRKGQHTLSEVLGLAMSDTILIRSSSGKDFVLEQADEFDREVAALGSSEKLASFLDKRSKETGDTPISEVREKRGV